MSAKKKTKKVAQAKKKVAKKTAKKTPTAKKTKKKIAKKPIKSKSTPVKKKTAKKTTKSATKKVATKKTTKTTKKAVAKKEKVATQNKKTTPATKKQPSNKATTKVSTGKKSNNLKIESSTTVSNKKSKRLETQDVVRSAEETRAMVLGARKRTSTPAIFKIKSRRNTPVLFTLEDVQSILQTRNKENEGAENSKKDVPSKSSSTSSKKQITETITPRKSQIFGAATLTDILGYNPNKEKSQELTAKQEASKIPSKYQKYYKALVELRQHFKDGLDLHTKETLKKSSKDDTGDLSGYGQHMADAGTDSFDRDFALSLVSNEQEALYEIEEAIQRIIEGSYGVCEITGKPIARERLMAVPFTRYSLDGQKELEKTRRRVVERAGVFADATAEDAQFVEDIDAE